MMWVNFGKEFYHKKPAGNCGLPKNQCSENHISLHERTGNFVLIIYMIYYLDKTLYRRGPQASFEQWRTQEFFSGVSTNSVEDRRQRERESGGGIPLVRGSGGSCNLVQEILFHIVKCS